ncbi:MAG: VOC family protein [Polyangiales bacterium]
MTSAARLSLVILAVRELARARRFYEGAFGWAVAVDVPVYVEYALPDGMRLGLYQRDAFAKNTGAPATPRLAAHTASAELYLSVDDLDAALARLAALGATCLSPPAPRPWGDTVAYYEDPDGHVVAVARV